MNIRYIVCAYCVILTGVLGAASLGQVPNVRLNNPSSTDPEEVTIAINPLDPRVLAAGANINYGYFSRDGGLTWNQRTLSTSLGVWGDPCVVFGPDGTCYYGHLSNPPYPGYWIDRIVIQRSIDGGTSYLPGVGIGFDPPRNQDKEWIGVDGTTSAYRGRVYTAWTEFDSYGSAQPGDSSRILFSHSTDNGASWSSPVRVSDLAGNCADSDTTVEGAVPAVGPNGEVYLSWSSAQGIMFDKSTDGGVTFGEDIFVTSQPGGWDFTVPGIYRCNGFPVTACDPSSSPYRGNVYIQWSDQRHGVGNTDIFFIKSTDGGASWGPVKQVNDDGTATQQFFSWMCVDPSTGYIYVVFYDRSSTVGLATDVTVAKSTDGGESFRSFRVSQSSFTPTEGIFFGDYTNIAARCGAVHPIWMRLDGSSLSVWTASLQDTTVEAIPMVPGWNLVSVPVRGGAYPPRRLFPAVSSSVFSYHGGYIEADTLRQGHAYWVKVPAADISYAIGDSLYADSIQVGAGWNLIGSLSLPVPTSQIGADPPGMTVSGFYRFNGSGYELSDTINPGVGYWVKPDAPGMLILNSGSALPSGWARLAILQGAEMPPAPPEVITRNTAPVTFALEQNYPNPFNPTTTIHYQLPHATRVILKVFDVLGREVAVLVDATQGAGEKSVNFDARGLTGCVYFYRITTGTYTETRKMILLK